MGNWRIAIWIGLILASVALGQSAQAALSDEVRAVLTPTNPNPGDLVSISLESYATDLSQAQITWWVNGNKMQEGKGGVSFEIEAPALGKMTTLVISVNTIDSGIVEKTVQITPARVTILFQANSYTPPFYRGKALAPSESSITAVAIPDFIDADGNRIGSKDIVFTWKRNSFVAGAQSGLGKNSYTFSSGRLPEDEPLVEVSASSPADNLRATARIRVPITFPRILFYEEHPLRGAFLDTALPPTFALQKNEMTVIAYPYFREGTALDNPSVSTNWKLNGSTVESGEMPNSITIRAPGTSGAASLSFSLQNMNKLFETAQRVLLIQFGSKNRALQL